MDKFDPPRVFGVFKPAGHTVLAFPDAAKMADGKKQLQSTGLTDDQLTCYTAQEMLAQNDADLAQAGVLAEVGQELNLVRMHRELALNGFHFLVAETADDDTARQVAEICRQSGATVAQQYGRFTIEDLIDPADGRGQVFESPDRGLDSKAAGQGDRD